MSVWDYNRYTFDRLPKKGVIVHTMNEFNDTYYVTDKSVFKKVLDSSYWRALNDITDELDVKLRSLAVQKRMGI